MGIVVDNLYRVCAFVLYVWYLRGYPHSGDEGLYQKVYGIHYLPHCHSNCYEISYYVSKLTCAWGGQRGHRV